MATETFSTLAETTTTADPGSGGVSLAVTSRSLFPQSGQFRIVVQDGESNKTNREVMLVTGGFGTGAGSFTVQRGMEGTTAVAHSASSYVAHVLTAKALQRHVSSLVRQPRMHKMIAWNFDPILNTTASGALTTQVMYVAKVYIAEDVAMTNFKAWVSSAGTTGGTDSRGFVYDGSGHQSGSTIGANTQPLLARTADARTPFSTTGEKTLALTAEAGKSLTLVGGEDVFVYVGVWMNGGTIPGFFRFNQAGMHNLGLVAADKFLFAQSAAQASIPSTFDLTTLSASSQPIWMGLS